MTIHGLQGTTYNSSLQFQLSLNQKPYPSKMTSSKYRILFLLILSLMYPKVSQNISEHDSNIKDSQEIDTPRSEGIGTKEGRDNEANQLKLNIKENENHSNQVLDQKNTLQEPIHEGKAQKKQILESDTVDEEVRLKSIKEREGIPLKPEIVINNSKNSQEVTATVSKIKIPSPENEDGNIVKVLGSFFASILPSEVSQFTQVQIVRMIDYISRKLFHIIRSYYQLYKILIDDSKPKAKKVYYEDNFANLYGGAKIIMKSSPKIKSINSILEDGPDKYMYTDELLPIKIIIGLNEQIAIDSIIIQSYEMYSCITKEFKVEGKFTMQDKKWVYLGTFKAENVFGDQQFYTERKIVRYVKITFLSAYGKWSYFTLTQIKIRGKGLFADALTELTDKKGPSTPPAQDQDHHESESHKQEQERPPNVCFNEFKPRSDEPQDSNLITSLITKIDSLELRNSAQNKQLETLSSRLLEVTSSLLNKSAENRAYEELLKEYKLESNRTFYVILFSLGLSATTLCCLVCLCLVRRKELLEINSKEKKLEVKKSNSFK